MSPRVSLYSRVSFTNYHIVFTDKLLDLISVTRAALYPSLAFFTVTEVFLSLYMVSDSVWGLNDNKEV